MSKRESGPIRSDREKILRQVIRRFVDEEVVPRAEAIDEAGEFPHELHRMLGKMGVYGMRYPVKGPHGVGGVGGDAGLYCAVSEELARGLVSLAAIYSMQGLMGTEFLFRYGTEEMHRKYLAPALAGELVPCFCLTEPDNASDLAGIKTIARREKDKVIVTGLKTWITSAPAADFFTVLCQTKPGSGLKGMSFVFVPRDAAGVSVSDSFRCVGTRSTPIAEVAFDEVTLPGENMLVDEKIGLRALLGILSEIRTMTAAIGLGLARAAFEASRDYAKERIQFGRPIAQRQMIQAHLAGMATNIHASELMVRNCCDGLTAGRDISAEAMMTKYFVCEAACDAADTATRVMGSYSYSMEYPVQRYWRDTRFLLYGGGTHEILQVNIGRSLLQ